MKKLDYTLTFISMLFVFLLGGQMLLAMGQTISPSARITTEIQQVDIREVKGEVLKVDTHEITLKQSNNNIATVPMQGNVKITRNGNPVNLNEIKPTDDATVTYSPDGEVIGVDTTPREVITTSRWMIPAITGLLVLLLLTIFILKKPAPNSARAKATYGP